MSSYGIVSFVYMSAIFAAVSVMGYTDWPPARLYLLAMGVMWTLGVVDDVFGSRKVGGFGGHFHRLIRERKFTTGAVKAIGGAAVALAAAWRISEGNIGQCLVAAVLIALSTNLLNLMDLRPGRAVAVFFAGLGVTCIVTGGQVERPWVVGSIAAVAFAFGLLDSRGKAMMGDSGSNALGVAMGLTLAINTNLACQLVCIALMAAVHVYSEKHSVSALVDGNRVLRAIDHLLGVR